MLNCVPTVQYEEDSEGVGESVSSSTSSITTPRRQKVSYLKRMAAMNKDNTLTLTLDDVHVSLQKIILLADTLSLSPFLSLLISLSVSISVSLTLSAFSDTSRKSRYFKRFADMNKS